jgi:molybdate transport system regulatory protein
MKKTSVTPLSSDELRVRAKIWLEDKYGQTIFGFGLFLALEAIERTGSMNAAAKEMKMGYRSLWGKIKKTEERIGKPLLMKQVGGHAGGHSDLTPFAQELLAKFQTLMEMMEISADKIFHNIFDE